MSDIAYMDENETGMISFYKPSSATTTGGAVFPDVSEFRGRKKTSLRSSQAVERAVYAHLQAMRALGHTQVAVSDIVSALGLSQATVLAALTALKKKGVKLMT